MAKTARRGTYQWIKTMSTDEISRLDLTQAREVLRMFREKFRYREKAFNRAGPNVYSPALEKMQNYYDRNGMQSTESMNSINRIRSELFHIQEFFNSKTGDVKGARQVMREQDVRIFGANEKGAPLHRMSIEERTHFWEIYDEFMNTFKNAEQMYTSGKIQQYLGEMTVSGRKSTGTVDMMKELNQLKTKLEESRGEQYNVGARNVLTGRRSN